VTLRLKEEEFQSEVESPTLAKQQREQTLLELDSLSFQSPPTGRGLLAHGGTELAWVSVEQEAFQTDVTVQEIPNELLRQIENVQTAMRLVPEWDSASATIAREMKQPWRSR
jgi:hypothetical protein